MKNNYDALVIGGGTGGAAIAKFLAQRGIDTGLIEKAKFNELHKICGDATSESHFVKVNQIDNKNKIEVPHGEEFYNIVKGFAFYSPTMKEYKIPSDGDGWIIARDRFGRRLIQEAGDAGVDLNEEVTVLKPIHHSTEDRVTGVTVKTNDKKTLDINAKIIVDASGMASIIRRQIDETKAKWDQIIRHYDLSAAYRELVQFTEPITDPDYIRLYFDSENCPGGYFWIFPQNEYAANVGLGVEPRRIEGGPMNAYHIWKKKVPELFNDQEKVIHGGGATVPLRRPMDTLVYGGVVLIGDAGACVRSTDGGGIGQSLISASYATGAIDEALQTGNYSRTGPLWNYNYNYMRDTGAKEAPLALMKVTLVTGTNREIMTILDNQVITAEDLYNLNSGEPLSLSLSSKIKRAYRGKTILPFLLRVLKTLRNMDAARKLYKNYPDNWNDFLVWKKQIVNLYRDEQRAIAYYKETGNEQMIDKVVKQPITTS